ncbi:MAG: hypothetical protein ACRD12_05625 [Acidimicrobiales bacterium]
MPGFHEMTLRLDSLDHLFAPNADAFSDSHSIESGFDTLAGELLAYPPKGPLRTTIVLPRSDITPGTEEQVRRALVRHCELRITHNENEWSSLRRQGTRALWAGIAVLAVGLIVADLITRSSSPGELRIIFGQGFFVVVAWVALWYPLDVLFHYIRPYRMEGKVLEAMRHMDVVVTPPD